MGKRQPARAGLGGTLGNKFPHGTGLGHGPTHHKILDKAQGACEFDKGVQDDPRAMEFDVSYAEAINDNWGIYLIVCACEMYDVIITDVR